jgi:hypothetical protein
VTFIFALILSLPVLLLQACGYLVVLPAALHSFQNFNSGEFNVLVQASQYYKFAATTLLAMGLLFQVPVAIMAVTRAGLVTPRQLRHNRRYAVLACGLVAAVPRVSLRPRARTPDPAINPIRRRPRTECKSGSIERSSSI